MPGTIEWVQDNELTDLQGVGDAERAGDELEEVRQKNMVPKGFHTLYEVNKAKHEAERFQVRCCCVSPRRRHRKCCGTHSGRTRRVWTTCCKCIIASSQTVWRCAQELMRGSDPHAFQEIARVYHKQGSHLNLGFSPYAAPSSAADREGQLNALRGGVLATGFDYNRSSPPPPPLPFPPSPLPFCVSPFLLPLPRPLLPALSTSTPTLLPAWLPLARAGCPVFRPCSDSAPTVLRRNSTWFQPLTCRWRCLLGQLRSRPRPSHHRRRPSPRRLPLGRLPAARPLPSLPRPRPRGPASSPWRASHAAAVLCLAVALLLLRIAHRLLLHLPADPDRAPAGLPDVARCSALGLGPLGLGPVRGRRSAQLRPRRAGHQV